MYRSLQTVMTHTAQTGSWHGPVHNTSVAFIPPRFAFQDKCFKIGCCRFSHKGQLYRSIAVFYLILISKCSRQSKHNQYRLPPLEPLSRHLVIIQLWSSPMAVNSIYLISHKCMYLSIVRATEIFKI